MTTATTRSKRRINVTFPVEVLELVDSVVPPRERNRFIVEAAEEAARRERLRHVLAQLRDEGPAWKDEDHPELATPEDIDRWIRKLREYGHSSYDWDTQLAEDIQNAD
ncbi:MAG: hypothetical protein SXV54_24655 [Chloroflexota bacterium]|nr:hypothetical protein [Chloroflexota bacterium]